MKHLLEQSQERMEHPADKLHSLMARMSERVNSSVCETYGIRDLVDGRGAISMDGFVGGAGYTKERVEADKNRIFELEVEWSGAREARVREFYATQYGAHTEKDIVRVRTQHKEKEKGRQMEIFTAILFNKMLKDNFIVVPASAYDDYMNGIDTVMVNRKTGDVVCTFDEVHDHKASNRADAKEEKIKKKARTGGSTLAYGVTIENGLMVRKEIKNLPVFFLSLTTEELDDALVHMEYSDSISEKERDIFGNFIKSLEAQAEMLSREKMPSAVDRNLAIFQESLTIMKSVAEKTTYE